MAIASAAKMVLLSGSLGQTVASYLTTLEMTVDDHCCTHSRIHIGSIVIDFIMWSLGVTILIEFDLHFLSGNHTFAYSFYEVLSRRVVFMCSQWDLGCLTGQIKSTLISADAMAASTLRSTGRVGVGLDWIGFV